MYITNRTKKKKIQLGFYFSRCINISRIKGINTKFRTIPSCLRVPYALSPQVLLFVTSRDFLILKNPDMAKKHTELKGKSTGGPVVGRVCTWSRRYGPARVRSELPCVLCLFCLLRITFVVHLCQYQRFST